MLIRYTISLLLGMLLLIACKKEKTPDPSNKDEKELTVADNPNDPIDHTIYQFYKATGIPLYYNDTIYKKQAGDSAGIPRYNYVKVSLAYNPLGYEPVNLILSPHREYIPAMLELLQTQVIPRLPKDFYIPSFLVLDSFFLNFRRTQMKLEDGWESWHGFNTVGIRSRDLLVMSQEDQKKYALSIVAGIASKRLQLTQMPALQKDFLSISRELGKPYFFTDIYEGGSMELELPSIPEPATFGFIRFVSYQVIDGVDFFWTNTPRVEDDLRMFLVAVLQYNTEAFRTKYSNDPALMKKFGVMQKLAAGMGLKLPN